MVSIIKFTNEGKEYPIETIVHYYGVLTYLILEPHYKGETIQICAGVLNQIHNWHGEVVPYNYEKEFVDELVLKFGDELYNEKAKDDITVVPALLDLKVIQGMVSVDFFSQYKVLQFFEEERVPFERLPIDANERKILRCLMQVCERKTEKEFREIGDKMYEIMRELAGNDTDRPRVLP
jgi:hypothetical protein